jgi:pyruvate/2-oxoglutarate dehydrogenase complex dihydrolipoamide acyltransferase (E2) component
MSRPGPKPEARVPVVLPDLGAAPVRVSVWLADLGDAVYEGDRLVEVCTGGATFDVSAPATGRLVERLALPPDELRPNQVLGVVATDPDG